MPTIYARMAVGELGSTRQGGQKHTGHPGVSILRIQSTVTHTYKWFAHTLTQIAMMETGPHNGPLSILWRSDTSSSLPPEFGHSCVSSSPFWSAFLPSLQSSPSKPPSSFNITLGLHPPCSASFSFSCSFLFPFPFSLFRSPFLPFSHSPILPFLGLCLLSSLFVLTDANTAT
jgi:hypothetical protein